MLAPVYLGVSVGECLKLLCVFLPLFIKRVGSVLACNKVIWLGMRPGGCPCQAGLLSSLEAKT